MPYFKGGQEGLIKYIQKNIKYPEEAKKNKIQGKVYVQFTVAKDGNPIDIKILKGVHPLLDEAAIDLILGMPKWKPGRQDGIPVDVNFNLPLSFRLPN